VRPLLALPAAVVAALALAAPAGATTAADLCAPTADPCVVAASTSVTSGSMLDFGSRDLVLRQRGTLRVGSGSMTIAARNVTLEPGAALLARGRDDGSQRGGLIVITATGHVRVLASGATRARIDLSSERFGGTVRLQTGGDVEIAGEIAQHATTPAGQGGVLTMDTAGSVVLAAGSLVNASGGSGAVGGSVRLTARGEIVVGGPIDVSGGDGGTLMLDSTGSGISTLAGARLDASATGTFNDGGSVTLLAAGGITLRGPVSGRGAGSTLEGGGVGGFLTAVARGSIEVAGGATADFSGTPPDGEGGEIDLAAGLDLVQGGTLVAESRGQEATGGSVTLTAGRALTLGPTSVAGGDFGGGEIATLAGETTSVVGEVNADGTGEGGTVEIESSRVVVRGVVRAAGLPGGLVDLAGCEVAVESTGQLATTGVGGENVLTASTRLTLAAGSRLTAGLANRFVHGDPATPPIVDPGATVVPAPRVVLNPALAQCERDPACGDGRREGAEECDDGNTAGCDRCSPTCREERCGNGRVDCGEQCDDGNDADGDGCDGNCTRTGCGNDVRTDPEECDDGNGAACDGCAPTCRVERCGNGVVECGEACDEGTRNGEPDAACDALCRVVARPECGDTRLDPGEECDDGNRRACDGCSAVCTLESCGDGTAECGEECDDRNTEGCDECSPTCREEVCGNGVVDCREQCDDGNGVDGDGCDGNCTRTRCGNGVVTPGEQCDDGNVFDEDGCDTSCRRYVPCPGLPGELCAICAVDTDCDPVGRCAGRACVDGACVPVAPVDCDDGREGNIDTCLLDAAGAPVCEHTCFAPAACDDTDACNGAERCEGGACAPGTAPDCDDRDPCTVDRCEPASGCRHEAPRGFPLTRCSLDAMDGALAAPAEIRPALRRKILRLTGAVRRQLAAAEAANDAGRERRTQRLLARAGGRLGRLERMIANARRREKVGRDLGEVLLTQGAVRAGDAVITLREELVR
jgi:cysteine-rich repeat protein